MTASDPPHPDVPVLYETAAPNAYRWTETAYDYLTGDKLFAKVEQASGIQTAVVTGRCPRCGDNVNFSQVHDAVSGESLGRRGPSRAGREAGYVELTVSCCCTEPHEGRPEGVSHGCGINFRVEFQQDTW